MAIVPTMGAKHHCLICGDLIYGGMYCSTCSHEIGRSRTMDDESMEEWIDRVRYTKPMYLYSEHHNLLQLDVFFWH